MDDVTGGHLLARALKDNGVETIFTLHGGHLEPLYQGCLESGIKILDTRHEAAAGHAASASAAVGGPVGVCAVTAGPGFANVYAAIMNAKIDCSPVLFIVGAAATHTSEDNVLQSGIDQIACATPAAKWARRVPSVELIPNYVSLALRAATTGRPGPAVLEVPSDIMNAVAASPSVEAAKIVPTAYRSGASPDQVAAAWSTLQSAQRPIFVVGGGARLSSCHEELVSLAEVLNAPVFSARSGQGVMPQSHPLAGHSVTSLARISEEDRPDVVLVVGARMGKHTGGRSNAIIPQEAKVIQIDIEASEVGKVGHVATGLVGDCSLVLQQLLDESRTQAVEERDEDWLERITAAHHAYTSELRDLGHANDPVHPAVAGVAIAEALRNSAPIFCVDGGEVGHWVEPFITRLDGSTTLTHGHFGFLGVGISTAMAAAVFTEGRPVVHITGDGAIGLHLQELDTYVRHGLPITTIVFNNRSWGMSLHWQEHNYPETSGVASWLGETADYSAVARALGMAGFQVDSADDVREAVRKAVSSGEPTLIEVLVDPEPIHPVTAAAYT